MAVDLPDLSEDEFRRRLGGEGRFGLGRRSIEQMHAHYRELRRWNRRMALVGSGLGDRVVERLFAESLAAMPLLGRGSQTIVDVGSGAGFPGLVLAAALPEARVVLIEPRQRKWAFLRAAADSAELSCECLNARVSAALPSGIPEAIDRVTVRALRLDREPFAALSARLTEGGSFLIWASGPLELPSELQESKAVDLGDGRGRVQEVTLRRHGIRE